MSGWIGVDLDGTLAHYDGWKGIDHIGAPILPMVERVKAWLAAGKTVKIFTARVAGPDEFRTETVAHIHRWLDDVGLPKLDVTNVKDFGMVELWDDRAVQVEPNTGRQFVLPSADLAAGNPYCPTHHRIAYQPSMAGLKLTRDARAGTAKAERADREPDLVEALA